MKYPDAEMHEINYGYNFDKDVIPYLDEWKSEEDNHVYVVDFRFTTEEFESLIAQGWGVHWCDHHATGIEEAAKFSKTYRDMGGNCSSDKAGAQLTWEYLYPDFPIPLAVYYVSKWDLWDHTDPKTIPFNRGLGMTETTDPAKPQAMDMWVELFENNREGNNRTWNALDQVMNLGVIGEAMKAQYDFNIAKNAYYVPDWYGYRTVALNSYVLDSYCIFEHKSKWEELDPEVLVWYYQTSDGQWSYSLRSYPGTNTNVRELAEKLGGGGHDGAAGAKCKELLIKPEV
jgi:oligoribonuclease NrnB/cAMP/cGMP phosphodiesterase (DHH superfamily)